MRLLDLFCGAGGCSVGYHRAGFDYIVGVDNVFQKNYPFIFIQADALEYLADFGHEYDVIHASPPCQKWSIGTPNPYQHPDLITPLRKLLLELGKPYVIENVRRAPIRGDLRICGCQVGLPQLRRVRHFEVNPPFIALLPPCYHSGPAITVTGHGTTTGNRQTWGRNIRVNEMREAMDIDWMNRDELSQAIPPPYTEWIGVELLRVLASRQNDAVDRRYHG